LEIRRLKKKLAQEENLNLIDRMNYQDNFEIVNASTKKGHSQKYEDLIGIDDILNM
jgi:hypothetical protein